MALFKNRRQAGRKLAEEISRHKNIVEPENEVVVLGVPRGGIVPAREVAEKLNAPLDVVLVKKIAAPDRPELAIGAIGETKGSKDVNQRIVKDLQVSQEYLHKEISRLEKEIKRREKLFRSGRKPFDLQGRLVIIVDDGAATGETIIAACREVWNNKPEKVVCALPVLAKDALEKLEDEADEVIFLKAPELFFAVGQFYDQFEQVSDQEAVEILKKTNND